MLDFQGRSVLDSQVFAAELGEVGGGILHSYRFFGVSVFFAVD